jgi:hypothetical protein
LSSPDPSKKLQTLIKRLRAEHPHAADCSLESCPEGHDPLVWQLVFAFMAWEASTAKAGPATRKLHAGVIDYNEMRVCLADELVAMIGERYPRAAERVQRLRSTLNEIYRREHAVTLHHLAQMPKRDARAYLESLEGMPPYVAARMMLLTFGGHAFPLDERIYHTLQEESAMPEGEFEEVSGWLERAFHAGEALEPYLVLETWLNDRPVAKPAKKPLVIKSPGKAKPDIPALDPDRPRKPLASDKGKPPGKKAGKI